MPHLLCLRLRLWLRLWLQGGMDITLEESIYLFPWEGANGFYLVYSLFYHWYFSCNLEKCIHAVASLLSLWHHKMWRPPIDRCPI